MADLDEREDLESNPFFQRLVRHHPSSGIALGLAEHGCVHRKRSTLTCTARLAPVVTWFLFHKQRRFKMSRFRVASASRT